MPNKPTLPFHSIILFPRSATGLVRAKHNHSGTTYSIRESYGANMGSPFPPGPQIPMWVRNGSCCNTFNTTKQLFSQVCASHSCLNQASETLYLYIKREGKLCSSVCPSVRASERMSGCHHPASGPSPASVGQRPCPPQSMCWVTGRKEDGGGEYRERENFELWTLKF